MEIMGLIRKIAIATVLAIAAATLLAACGGSAPDAVACKTAMEKAYAAAVQADSSAAPASEPAACKGVPVATIRQYVAQIMATTPA